MLVNRKSEKNKKRLKEVFSRLFLDYTPAGLLISVSNKYQIAIDIYSET